MAIQKPTLVAETEGLKRLQAAIKDGDEAYQKNAPIIEASRVKLAHNHLAALSIALTRAKQAKARLAHLAAYADDPERMTKPHTDAWLDALNATLCQATADVITSARVISNMSMRAIKQSEATA